MGERGFGSIRRKIAKLKKQLVDARIRAAQTGHNQEVREIEDQLRETYERDEITYRQRSRTDWLQAGDQNTKYFQARATHRRRKNTVKALLKEDDSRSVVNEDMREVAASLYEQLFSSEGSAGAQDVLSNIAPAVSDDMNAKLIEQFSDQEIEKALFQMGPTKASSPDGLPALFYQCHWALVKEDVCAAVKDFLNGAATPDSFNATVIVMIPKISSPELMS
ncbi:uncharacterized protein [Aegilops tauschii subsp. strangulata]|uniref:uncharacterized protein n=1 Tax=Aegilops tauschii subsp. strangulata TaxID=200361 RepID=UPI003CC8A9AE